MKFEFEKTKKMNIQSIDDLRFPFLMCEIKCDNEKFDYPDRQNMHNCNVTVKTLFKFEQKTNQYRKNKQFENLFDKIFIYFISHDQKNVCFYEHYVLIKKKINVLLSSHY